MIVCVFIGTIIQWLGLPSIDHDELEAVRWGATKSWFVDKHPPLVGFVAYNWAKLTLFSNFAFFALSKLNALIALFVIYRLNKIFLSTQLAIISTASYASTYAYIVLMSQLDANGILHLLWPLFALLLWKSITDNRYQDWILLGATASLSMLGKYQSAMIILTALAMILSIKSFRKHLYNFKLYASLAVFILLLLPHYLAYLKTDYSMSEYIFHSSEQNSLFYGRWSIIKFSFVQTLTGLFGFYILIWNIRQNIYFPNFKRQDNKTYFLFFMAIVLPAAPIIFSLISGVSILGSWGLTSWFLFPTFLLYIFRNSKQNLSLKPYMIFLPVYLVIMGSIVILNNFYPVARPTSIPKAMQEIELQWSNRIESRIDTVITNSRPAQGMVFYSESKPQIINSNNPESFSWILNQNKCTNGPTLIIAELNEKGHRFLKNMRQRFGKPSFFELINVKSSRHKITLTNPLQFQVLMYNKSVCFD